MISVFDVMHCQGVFTGTGLAESTAQARSEHIPVGHLSESQLASTGMSPPAHLHVEHC